jgi:hypothetical protein
MPLAALSVYGLQVLAERTSWNFKHWVVAVLFLAIPTNVIIITSGLQAISEKPPTIFIEGDLMEGLQWINANAGKDALVLADERAGLYVPSITGRRVIYGHPFETIKAGEELELLENFFSVYQDNSYYGEVLESRGVDYVLCREDQEENFTLWLQTNWKLVYQSDKIDIYAR